MHIQCKQCVCTVYVQHIAVWCSTEMSESEQENGSERDGGKVKKTIMKTMCGIKYEWHESLKETTKNRPNIQEDTVGIVIERASERANARTISRKCALSLSSVAVVKDETKLCHDWLCMWVSV